MAQRNRSEGWKHAKLSGHENESLIENLMKNNSDYQKSFLARIGKPNARITYIDYGGLCEKPVECVFPGEMTTSKTDMHIVLDDGSRYNVSIKKSLHGQVFIISIDRFIRGYEKQYNTVIPPIVKKGISLFWGFTDEVNEIISEFGVNKSLEEHQRRAFADTIKAYDKTIYNALLSWFMNNTKNLADFCFSKGLVKSSDEWANVIWYKNELGENSVDEIFMIDDICDAFQRVAEEKTFYGTRGGGTTIQLAFGFVQWHSPRKTIPGLIQFHHKYENIETLMD